MIQKNIKMIVTKLDSKKFRQHITDKLSKKKIKNIDKNYYIVAVILIFYFILRLFFYIYL
jgi:hypothetical protein